MAKLLLKGANGQTQELLLNTGLNRVGRNSANDIQIEHPSVSSFHCELNCAGDAVMVKDLGSTNGTFIERAPIQEGSLAPGQRLQLGSVELVLDGAPKAAAIPVAVARASPTQSPASISSVRLAHHLPPSGAVLPAIAVAQPAAPTHSGPPKPSFQADRNSAEQQARSKMLWGDPPEDVTKYLMMQGFSVDEARALTAVLLQERVKMLRGIGTRKLLTGVGMMCVPLVTFLIMAHMGVIFVKLLGVAGAVGLWGAYLCLRGLFMVLSPKSEPGDVADK